MADTKSDPIHSTGRGGAGNIGRDPTTYVDGGIVREGKEGEATSAGRGGAGNITPARGGTPTPGQKSSEVVPEPAMKVLGAGKDGDEYENYHTGRGGEGNVHKDKYGGHSKPQPGQEGHRDTLFDKAKHAIGLDKHKGEEKK